MDRITYHTIEPPKKFPTLFKMRRPAPLAVLLFAACATAPAGPPPPPPPGGPIVEVRRAFTCPLPPSRGLTTIARDGKAERVVFDGFEFEVGKTKSTREQMTLAPADAAELFRVVADSDWQTIPAQAEAPALSPGAACPDCCSGSLMIKTVEGNRILGFAADRKPARLEALLKGIDAILARGTWKRVIYDWEPQR